ncbi:MAG: LCP family protein [Acidimicrobiales bacterium]
MRRPVVLLATVVALLALGVVAAVAPPSSQGQGAAIEIHEVHEGHFLPVPGQPLFMLALGSDGRRGLEGQRSDAIHLIGVNPGAAAGTILNFPRDTYVDIPGRGRDKINAALQLGGPDLVADTVRRLTGIPIAFVIITNFDGLVAMVDELGGLAIDIPVKMADRNSGAFFEAGPSRLGGRQTLALSRNRYIPGGDFKRTEHQGLIILSALAQLRTTTTSPADTLRQLAVLGRHSDINGVGLPELYRLGRMALSLDPANVRNVTMPGRVGQAGAASVVFPAAGSDSLFADIRDDAVLQAH